MVDRLRQHPMPGNLALWVGGGRWRPAARFSARRPPAARRCRCWRLAGGWSGRPLVLGRRREPKSLQRLTVVLEPLPTGGAAHGKPWPGP